MVDLLDNHAAQPDASSELADRKLRDDIEGRIQRIIAQLPSNDPLILELNGILSDLAKGTISPRTATLNLTALTPAIEHDIEKEKEEHAQEFLNTVEAFDRGEYTLELTEEHHRIIAARTAHIDFSNPQSVQHYAASYLSSSMSDPAKKSVTNIMVKVPEFVQQAHIWNALPEGVKVVTVHNDITIRARLDHLLTLPEYQDDHVQSASVLWQIKKYDLFGLKGIEEIIVAAEKHTLATIEGEMYNDFSAAKTLHEFMMNKGLIASMLVLKHDHPEIRDVCDRLGEQNMKNLFHDLAKNPEHRQKIEASIALVESGKVAFNDLPDDMKNDIASFQTCYAAQGMADQKMSVGLAEEMHHFVSADTKEFAQNPKLAARITELKKLEDQYEQAPDATSKAKLEKTMFLKYDHTLKAAAHQYANAFKDEEKNAAAWLVAEQTKEKKVAYDETTALFIDMGKKDDITDILTAKNKAIDEKTAKQFGLNGNVAHDVTAIINKLDQTNIKLSDFNANGDMKISADELLAAMNASATKLACCEHRAGTSLNLTTTPAMASLKSTRDVTPN